MEGKQVLIKLQLRASRVRMGDRLVADERLPNRIVVQVKRTPGGVTLSHGLGAETQFSGDPLVWIWRARPRVVEEELPHTIWRPRGPRRVHPWEATSD